MLSRVISYSALFSKVHAMTATTLSRADFARLIKMGTVSDVAEFLKQNTRYADVLQEINPAAVHRGELEELLSGQISRDIKALEPYLDASSVAFFRHAVELDRACELMKLYLSLLYEGIPQMFLTRGADIIVGREIITKKSLASAHNFSEFILCITDTVFYKALSSFESNTQRQKPFFLETALDLLYTENIFKYAKKYLSKEDAKLAEKSYGSETDIQNISLILRAKTYFSIEPDQLYGYIIPKYYRLSRAVMQKMAAASSVDEIYEIINNDTPYGKAFSKNDRFLEKRTHEYLLHLNTHLYRVNPYSIQAALGYVFMRKIEIKNIISIIEGIRYGLPTNETAAHLIGYGGEGITT